MYTYIYKLVIYTCLHVNNKLQTFRLNIHVHIRLRSWIKLLNMGKNKIYNTKFVYFIGLKQYVDYTKTSSLSRARFVTFVINCRVVKMTASC
jgi:hypothetical protein